MRKFTFRLQRVLDWRAAQSRLAKAELGRLKAGVATLDAELAAVASGRDGAQGEMLAAGSVSGGELQALHLFREHSAARTVALKQRRAGEQQGVDRHITVVMDRSREARLLERLRERRFAEWHAATERETEQQAAENYLLRWNRSQ